jgi:hypothetical protein
MFTKSTKMLVDAAQKCEENIESKNIELSSSSTPPSKEEEEEIKKRFKERPKDLPPILNRKKWEAEVLRNIRNLEISLDASKELFKRHKEQALSYDMKKQKGMNIYACGEYVELSNGTYCRQVRYDVSDEEWKALTGWE